MSIFLRRQRSNLLKKFIAPVVLSSSLFSSTNANKYPWEIKDAGIRCIFDNTYNILWIDGVDGNKTLSDTSDGKIANSVNNKIKKFKKNDKGIEIRFVKNGIINIEEFVFSYIENLRKISFPEGFREISYGSLEECSELEEINFPKEMVSLRSEMTDCEKLKRIILPQCSGEICFSFDGCESLEIIEFPEKIKELQLNWLSTFSDCYNLREIKNFPKFTKRPDGKSYSLLNTFEDCKNLNEIEIKSDEKLRLIKTFKGCESAIRISVENVQEARNIIDNCYSLMVLELKNCNPNIKPIEGENINSLIFKYTK